MKNKLNELQNIIQNTTKNFSKNSHTKLNEEKIMIINLTI